MDANLAASTGYAAARSTQLKRLAQYIVEYETSGTDDEADGRRSRSEIDIVVGDKKKKRKRKKKKKNAPTMTEPLYHHLLIIRSS